MGDDQTVTDQLNARKTFEASLARLRLDYIDLYLVHWPTPGLVSRTWKAMEGIYETGKCKAIGVSNHSIGHLGEILRVAKTPPTVNQVKFSPFGYNQPLLDYCTKHGVVIEAYSPLTIGRNLHDTRLGRIAETYHKSPAQILIRWALQKNVVVLPKSQQRGHIAENAEVFDFEITPQDMDLLDRLGQ